MVASEHGHEKITRLLLRCQADVNATRDDKCAGSAARARPDGGCLRSSCISDNPADSTAGARSSLLMR